MVLRQPGAWFDWAAAGTDGTLYALAIEPEGVRDPPQDRCEWPSASATILAIDPDGEVRYRITVLEP